MSYIFNTGAVRPNRLTSVKNQTYHKDYAKFCLTSMNNNLYRAFINKCLINWSFFKGGDGQWIFEEDIESFLDFGTNNGFILVFSFCFCFSTLFQNHG